MTFVFIHESQPQLGAPKSSLERKLIRRQCMKDIAAERIERGKQRRTQAELSRHLSTASASRKEDSDHASSQPCSSESSPESTSETSQQGEVMIGPPDVTEFPLPPLYASLAMQGMEKIMVRYDVKLDSMSLFSAFNSDPSAGSPLLDDFPLLRARLSRRRWDYLPLIRRMSRPPAFLLHATACLAETLWTDKVLQPSTAAVTPSANYCKALRSLQGALDGDTALKNSEILCGIHMLAMIEVLRPTKRRAWKQHLSGVSFLIQARGPYHYHTELDIALLLAFVSLSVTDALYSGTHSFLQEPAWQATMLGMIESGSDPLAYRSPLVIRLQALSCHLPGLFEEVSQVVCYNHGRIDRSRIQSLWARIKAHRHQLSSIRDDFELILAKRHLDTIYSSRGPEGGDVLAAEILNIIVRSAYLSGRLLAALDIASLDILSQETARADNDALRIEGLLRGVEFQSDGFGPRSPSLKSCVSATTVQWTFDDQQLVYDDTSQAWRLISREMFERWCTPLGISVGRIKYTAMLRSNKGHL